MDNIKENKTVSIKPPKRRKRSDLGIFWIYLGILIFLLNLISLSFKGDKPVDYPLSAPGPAVLTVTPGKFLLSPVPVTSGEANDRDSKVEETDVDKNKQELEAAETYRKRVFTWENIKQDIIVTTLLIPEKALENEIRDFGVARGMKNFAYLKRQGIKKVGEKYEVDYAEVYQRNLVHFGPITSDLSRSAGVKPNQDPLVNLLRFVQYIEYKIPPKYQAGRYIREFYTPLQCLDEKKGDCDTKAILLAEFIGTYPESKERMGIIILKGYGIFHALLAIKRNPLPGTLKLYFHGIGYFMPLEVSGPGLMPGFVDHNSYNCLKEGLFRMELLN